MPETDLRLETITSQSLEAVSNITELYVKSYYFVGKTAELLKVINTQASHYLSFQNWLIIFFNKQNSTVLEGGGGSFLAAVSL